MLRSPKDIATLMNIHIRHQPLPQTPISRQLPPRNLDDPIELRFVGFAGGIVGSVGSGNGGGAGVLLLALLRFCHVISAALTACPLPTRPLDSWPFPPLPALPPPPRTERPPLPHPPPAN